MLANTPSKKAQVAGTPMRIIPKRLYSIKESAVYLGRSVWAVREMLWAGKIPFVKDGRRMLLDIRDMDTWIESSKTQMTS
ncbi:MAG: excisionase family DNA-binding protein [Syntrophales bacterium]